MTEKPAIVDRAPEPAEHVAGIIDEHVMDLFGSLERLGAAVSSLLPAPGADLSRESLAALDPVIARELDRQPLLDGLGYVAAPGALPGLDRFLQWLQRDGDRYRPARLNLDPDSVDLYDYTQMDWFTIPRDEGRPCLHGPWIDYTCADSYVLTLSSPLSHSPFVGVVAADVPMSRVEPLLLRALRGAPPSSVLVSAERRVLATNSSRWAVGSRLPAMPRVGDGEFMVVQPVGALSGWHLAVAGESP